MKTAAAIAAGLAVIALWIICLRMLLTYAGKHDDPGAYIMLGGVFLMLPAAAVLLIAAITRDRAGYWDKPTCECSTRDEWLTKHGDTRR